MNTKMFLVNLGHGDRAPEPWCYPPRAMAGALVDLAWLTSTACLAACRLLMRVRLTLRPRWRTCVQHWTQSACRRRRWKGRSLRHRGKGCGGVGGCQGRRRRWKGHSLRHRVRGARAEGKRLGTVLRAGQVFDLVLLAGPGFDIVLRGTGGGGGVRPCAAGRGGGMRPGGTGTGGLSGLGPGFGTVLWRERGPLM